MATHSSNVAWKIPWTEELGLGGHKEWDMTEHTYAPFDPAIPLHDIYPKELELWTWRDIGTPIFPATLFTIGKIGKQTSCLLTAEWIKKMWGICIYVYIYVYMWIYLYIYIISWRKAWQPTLVFLSGESHGQRSLVGCSPWRCRVKHD